MRRTWSAVMRPWWSHCQICERLISAVAASSIRLLIATAPDAVQPGRDVLDADGDVVAQALLRDLARRRGDVEEVAGAHVDVVALALDLVGPVAEDVVERLERDRDEIGVRDPRAVEALRRPRAPCPRAPSRAPPR